MLKKITPLKYMLASLIVFLCALVLQMSQGKDCAWDGCYATAHPTIAGSLFGFPIVVLQVEVLLGVAIWIAKKAKSSKNIG